MKSRVQTTINYEGLSSKSLEHKNVTTRRKKKKKIFSEEVDSSNKTMTNMAKTVITTELIIMIEVHHPLIQKRLFSF